MNEIATASEKSWAFEDLAEGVSIAFGPKTVSAAEIVDFAGQFDAQPMHLDANAAAESLLGGLAASGWHSCALFMRMIFDAFLADSTSQGSPGIAEARWKRPVLAGDTLSGHSTVTARRRLNSRPGLGLVTFHHTVVNQNGETVMELENPIMFALRAPERPV